MDPAPIDRSSPGSRAWWSRERAPLVPLRAEAPAPPQVEAAANADVPAAVSPATSAREATATPPPIGEPERQQSEIVATHPSSILPGRVDARFVDTSGLPRAKVLVDRPGAGSTAVVTSGDDGRAELSFDSWRQERGRPTLVESIDVRARLEGCATVILRATVRSGELTHLGDVVLVPGVTLRGRVVDPDGIGLDGARVGVAPVDLEAGVRRAPDEERMHRHGSENVGRHAFTHNGLAGAFVLEGVAAGPWRLWAHKEERRYAWSEPFEVASGIDENGLELVLEPLRASDRIDGRVEDPVGNPVANAFVIVIHDGENEGGSTYISTNAEGQFRVIVFVEGTYRIFAYDREERFAEGAAFGLRPGDHDLVAVLPERRMIEVHAKDAATGQPVHDVTLEVAEAERQWSRSFAPGESRFHVPAFSFLQFVRAQGRREIRLGPLDPLTVGEKIDVEFGSVARVQGFVGANGEPFAGARVQVVSELEEGSRTKNGFPLRMAHDPSAESKTKEDGTFEVGVDLDVSERVFVRILAAEWATVELGPMSAREATGTAHDVELTRGGAIEGRVLRPDGRDGAGVIVGINCGDGDARTVRAGPGGAYRFELLRPGPWQVGACDTEHSAGSVWTTTEDAGTPIEWSCHVEEDRTTSFDLVVER